ncbi:MAG: hypothetical protein ACI9GW_000911 [Halieaceae bacterium]|jgi:uncharacterized protein YdbL (DUF1318 family)
MKKLIVSTLMALFFAHSALAIDLDSAKDQGLVGEGNRGYLAYVVKPPSDEVMALVKMVNNLRRDKFTESAKGNGISVDKVAGRFYERATGATKAGNYFQSPAGAWLRK